MTIYQSLNFKVPFYKAHNSQLKVGKIEQQKSEVW